MCSEKHDDVEEAMGWLNDDIKKLKEEIIKENERTGECQREIERLRRVLRDINRIAVKISKPDYEELFALWGGFDDEESPCEVKAKCFSVLGVYDSYSFKGFCAGFAAAAKIINEG